MMELATETRDLSYKEVREGVCPKQAAVLDVLKHKRFFTDDMTNNEIAHALGWPINSVTGRVYELREMALVEPSDKRSCRITGRTCMAWKPVSLS
jgi:DNA-binding IclR family transcriptional regulator